MIPCKMPDDNLATLSETLRVLEQAYELTQKMLEENNNADHHEHYQELAQALHSVKIKALEIHHRLL